jgi:hypothetical protein
MVQQCDVSRGQSSVVKCAAASSRCGTSPMLSRLMTTSARIAMVLTALAVWWTHQVARLISRVLRATAEAIYRFCLRAVIRFLTYAE